MRPKATTRTGAHPNGRRPWRRARKRRRRRKRKSGNRSTQEGGNDAGTERSARRQGRRGPRGQRGGQRRTKQRTPHVGAARQTGCLCRRPRCEVSDRHGGRKDGKTTRERESWELTRHAAERRKASRFPNSSRVGLSRKENTQTEPTAKGFASSSLSEEKVHGSGPLASFLREDNDTHLHPQAATAFFRMVRACSLERSVNAKDRGKRRRKELAIIA